MPENEPPKSKRNPSRAEILYFSLASGFIGGCILGWIITNGYHVAVNYFATHGIDNINNSAIIAIRQIMSASMIFPQCVLQGRELVSQAQAEFIPTCAEMYDMANISLILGSLFSFGAGYTAYELTKDSNKKS